MFLPFRRTLKDGKEGERMSEKKVWASGAARRNALARLSLNDRRKYEIARELGLLERVREVGWAGLSAKETGRIGGLLGRERRGPSQKGE